MLAVWFDSCVFSGVGCGLSRQPGLVLNGLTRHVKQSTDHAWVVSQARCLLSAQHGGTRARALPGRAEHVLVPCRAVPARCTSLRDGQLQTSSDLVTLFEV
jgi:hypothetical protein